MSYCSDEDSPNEPGECSNISTGADWNPTTDYWSTSLWSSDCMTCHRSLYNLNPTLPTGPFRFTIPTIFCIEFLLVVS